MSGLATEIAPPDLAAGAPSPRDETSFPQVTVADSGRMWNRAYLVLFASYFVIGLALRWAGWIHADAAWFVAAARKVLDGSFDLYSFRAMPALIPPEGATYAYSPLTAIVLAPFVGVADALGWGEGGAERLSGVPLLVADVLAMQQMRRLVRSWNPGVDERFLFSGVVVTLFLTSLLGDSAYYSHNEGLMLLFVLLALRLTPSNLVVGGVCAGLAIAAKQTTLLDLLPVGLVLLVGRRVGLGRPVRAFVWGGMALVVFGAFMLVPTVLYPDKVYYAFVTQIVRLPTFGSGLPSWIDRGLQTVLSPGDYTAAHAGLLDYANWALVGMVGLACALIVWRAGRRGQPIGLVDSRLLALVAFAAVAQVALGKWVSGHYYQVPLALVFAWDIVRRASDRSGREPIEAERAGWAGGFPWIGLGAAVGFRSITQVGVPWFKDGLLLVLFVALAVVTLFGAGKVSARSGEGRVTGPGSAAGDS